MRFGISTRRSLPEGRAEGRADTGWWRMTELTFVFGIGAAKAGTSWLHDYLAGHPDVHFRDLKELHYFSSINGRGGDWPHRLRQKQLTDMRRRLARWPDSIGNRQRMLRLCEDIQVWHRIFDGKTANDTGYVDFLTARAQGARVVGEITPAYATLDTQGFKTMAEIAPRTRFIMLLRAPMDRLWSNVRMTAKRAAAEQGTDADRVAHAQIEAFIRDEEPGLQQRSDYVGTIRRLLSAVPRKNVLFEFFETLFTPGALGRITDFLGLAPREGDLSRNHHQGEKMQMPEGLRERVLLALAPQYEFIRTMFGDRLPPRWQDHYGQLELAGH